MQSFDEKFAQRVLTPAGLEDANIDWAEPRASIGRHVREFDGFRVTPNKTGDQITITIYRKAHTVLRWDMGDRVAVGHLVLDSGMKFIAIRRVNTGGYTLTRSKPVKAGERPSQMSVTATVGEAVNKWFDGAHLIEREHCYVRSADEAIMIPLADMYPA